ncbi:kinesin-like protein KIF28 isoform X2 [Tubulanus polymorphus]
MLEIYNEQVRDLLSKENPKGGLQVRQNPKLGLFYVQNLKKVPVGSYVEIERRMEQGTANRTVASTNMNATSSRAHTVVTITFDQISKNDNGSETKKSSVMNLVDLAGSERADSTGATGDRLKEGANINKSLSALGNVISALADLSMGKKKVMVPYRDSVLTKLLQNALGGNSKTIMIAALSPADINFDETLGTLRYADRAKKIKNKAVINENPLDKLIRELREENERLKKAMDGGGMVAQPTGSPEEMERMRAAMEDEIKAQLLANQELLAESSQSWEEKLKVAQNETDTLSSGSNDASRKSKDPHIINLNEDPMLAGVICHFFQNGETTIGRKDGEPTIILSGLSIMKNHAVIVVKGDGEAEIRPGDKGAKTKINGTPLTGTRTLTHKDRILFGSNHMYVFYNPLKTEASSDLPATIDWEYAQKEIAQAKGFATGGGAGLSKDQQIAQEQILEILPMVTEVNAISEELDKQRTFEVVLLSGAAQEGIHGEKRGTKVMVKMKNLLNGNTWLWERGKFMNRRYLMGDLYQKYLDGEDVTKIPRDEDPFWEPAEDMVIGTANVFLQSLGYALDFDDKLTVTDYKGQEEAQLFVSVSPCTQTGKSLDDDYFVDNPNDLLEKPFHFKVQVRSAEVQKSRFSKGLRVQYRVFKETEYTNTETVRGTLSPEFKHSRIVSFPSMTPEHLEYFENGCITLALYGLQEDTLPDPKLTKLTTKELRQMEQIQLPNLARRSTTFGIDAGNDQSQLKSELMLLQRKFERLENKERRLQQICDDWGNKPKEEQQFDPFYRTISALANSTGNKLKTRVQILNKAMSGYKLLQAQKKANQPNGTTADSAKIVAGGEPVAKSRACTIM